VIISAIGVVSSVCVAARISAHNLRNHGVDSAVGEVPARSAFWWACPAEVVHAGGGRSGSFGK
jgi:hypothetical protein